MHTRVERVETGVLLGAEYLRAGEVVAFPTETVYGLGADARREEAVRKIYAAKGRPMGNPLIVHIADPAEARPEAAGGPGYTASWPVVAERLTKRFWPGPLTVIVPRGPALSELVGGGRHTVAMRCPKDAAADALLRTFGGPIAAPSANRSGFTSPTTAGHVLAELDGRIPLILDGGPCAIGLESTVVDCAESVPRILRPGAITVEMVREAIGDVQLAMMSVRPEESAASPGLQMRHYAPRTAAWRFERGKWEWAKGFAEGMAARGGPVVLISGEEGMHLAAPHETIRMPGDAAGYARALYGALREADGRGMRAILVAMPGERGGMWTAVEDRLRRATEELA